jgi:uncharacterized integral membrane protein
MMEWTLGTIMFCVGVAGAVFSVIAGVVAVVLLRRGKQRIMGNLNEEYGRSLK